MNHTIYNDILSNITFNTTERLEEYLKYLCNKYGVSLNLHDIAGISQIEESLTRVLTPYLYHNNPFCNYLKKYMSTEKACARNKEVLCKLFQKKSAAFFGMCYMGIEELRYPIHWNGRLIAFLCVGQFCSNKETIFYRLKKNSEKYKFNLNEAIDHFNLTTKKLDFDLHQFSTQIGLLLEYLSSLYGRFLLSSTSTSNTDQLAEQHKKNYIIERTLRYINENYSQNLTLKFMAATCFCSEPYLSALFKQKVGTTLTDYIQSRRIIQAKMLLDVSDKPITDIAFDCGFSDSNYFTRTFKKHTGLSPSEFRKRPI